MYSKLKCDKFLDVVKKAYRLSHETEEYFPCENTREVVRGRGHCISGIVEDAFAAFLKAAIPSDRGDLTIFVDQPIVIDKAAQPRYPDIMVCRESNREDYEIVYCAELKTNTGWKRAQLNKLREDVVKLSGRLKSAKTITGKDYANRSIRYSFEVSPFMRFDVIVVAAADPLPVELEEMLVHFDSLPDECTRAMVLLRGEVNEWYAKKSQAYADHKAFKLLMDRIGASLG